MNWGDDSWVGGLVRVLIRWVTRGGLGGLIKG